MITLVGLLAAVSQAKFPPTSTYETSPMEGWTLRIGADVRAHPDDEKKALDLLKSKLVEIKKLLRPDHVKKLQEVTIWIDWTSDVPMLVFHPSADWLKQHGYNPDMGGCVQLGNVEHFLKWTVETQPMDVLHELAHSYQFRVLGEKDTRIADCFAKVVASHKYDSVEYVHGGKKKAYALTNQYEYFAETTEAFYGKNDFQPFNREELKTFDPDGYRLMEEIWLQPVKSDH